MCAKTTFSRCGRLFAYTGMRRSEALDAAPATLTPRTAESAFAGRSTPDWEQTLTKTYNARGSDVDDETLQILASYKVKRAELSFQLAKADAYVFGDDDGQLRSPDAITSRWSRRLDWLTAAHPDIHRVTIKGLRHTHATQLLERGTHPKVVQERLGHTTITTTMNIYSHVTPTMQRSAIDELARQLSEA